MSVDVDPLPALQQVLGDGVRAGSQLDAVAGVVPGAVAAPASVDELVQTVRESARAGLSVIPRGAGTKLGWGSPPRSADLVLEVRRLNDVLEHNPGDLIVRAQAGLPLATLQEQLAGAGQLLALDPPEDGATLGGVVAANAAGPRRLRYGTVRDLLIGVTVVLPDGTLAHAGGKVVKNVAGYDLGKLFTGSFGTLGVVVETIWRLHPLPAAQRTVELPYDGPRAAGELVQSILNSAMVPTAVELIRAGGGTGSFIVLFEGVEPAVAAQAQAAAALHPGGTVGDSVPAQFGARPYGPEDVALKISTMLTGLPAVLEALESLERDLGLVAAISAHAGTGVVWAGWPATPGAVPVGVERLRAAVAPHDGSVVVTGPRSALDGLDPWGPTGDALPLMRRVKERFDPDGRFSPGRFVGGI